jgi:hypothetical protein
MSALSVTALGPILVLLAVLATDVWVYGDAKANAERGTRLLTWNLRNRHTPCMATRLLAAVDRILPAVHDQAGERRLALRAAGSMSISPGDATRPSPC